MAAGYEKSWGAQALFDLIFWRSRRAGLFLEPAYGVAFNAGHTKFFAITAGTIHRRAVNGPRKPVTPMSPDSILAGRSRAGPVSMWVSLGSYPPSVGSNRTT